MTAEQWQVIAAKLRADPARRVEALSLLRGLLRECTYLPDLASRKYMKNHILDRYRAYQPQTHFIKPLDRQAPNDRIIAATRTARRAFAQLQKANDGHMPQLTKILFMTYGRTGKRRYELLKPVIGGTWNPVKLKMPNPASKSYLQHKLEDRFSDIKPGTLDALPKMTPSLEALLRSQLETRPTGAPRHMPKTLNVDIPKLNSWLRPMPQVRIKNKATQWYWDMLSRILPPLPQHEWHELRKLAHGVTPWEGVAKRRPMQGYGQPGFSSLNAEVSGVMANEQSTPGNRAPHYITLSYEIKPLKNSPPRRFLRMTRPHALSSRFMRHLYQKLFQLCPMITHNSEEGTYKVRWGTAEPEGISDMTIQTRRINKSLLSVLEGEEPEKVDDAGIK